MVVQQTVNKVKGNPGFAFLLAWIMWLIDLLIPALSFTGLNFRHDISWYLNFFRLAGGTLIPLILGFTAWKFLESRNHDRETIILTAILVAFTTFIAVYGGPKTYLHIVIPWLIMWSLPEDYMPNNKKTIWLLRLYILDFIGHGIIGLIFPANFAEVFGNSLVFPIWIIFTAKWGNDISGNLIYRATMIGMVLILTFYFINGWVSYGQALNNIEESRRGFIGVLRQSIFNMGEVISEIGHDFRQIFNTSAYLPGTQEKTEDPQGIFIEPLEPGHIFTEGMPVYAWALLEARTLDDPITAIISCKTERETEYGEQEIMGTADPSTLTVIKGAERSISCEFPPLPEDNYEIIFNAEFDFAADARRKIYLMDRERMLNDFRLLSQKGLEPSREGILREIYDITDTDPELIFTSGPISIGMKTDNVPWDVGRTSQSTLKPLFGVTITNYWPKGGRIKRINNLYFKIPEEMTLLYEDFCDPNTHVKPTNQESEPGYNVYELDKDEYIRRGSEEDILIDIDEFRTFNCRIEVNENSLDNVPVTTRFLKVHVDYDYVLEEELDIEVEGYDIGEGGEVEGRNLFCCQVHIKDMITNTWEISHYEQTPTLEECYLKTESHVHATDVDSKYCERECCAVQASGGISYHWVDSAEECQENYHHEGYTKAELTQDKSNC